MITGCMTQKEFENTLETKLNENIVSKIDNSNNINKIRHDKLTNKIKGLSSNVDFLYNYMIIKEKEKAYNNKVNQATFLKHNIEMKTSFLELAQHISSSSSQNNKEVKKYIKSLEEHKENEIKHLQKLSEKLKSQENAIIQLYKDQQELSRVEKEKYQVENEHLKNSLKATQKELTLNNKKIDNLIKLSEQNKLTDEEKKANELSLKKLQESNTVLKNSLNETKEVIAKTNHTIKALQQNINESEVKKELITEEKSQIGLFNFMFD